MADPKRLDILKKLTAHLQTITVANGYSHELATAVFRGRTVFDDQYPVPMLSILESPRALETIATSDFQARKDEWQLLVQGWVTDDQVNPTDPAYLLADDVEKCLTRLITTTNDGSGRDQYPAEYLLGRSIAAITFGPSIVRPPIEQVSSKAFFYLPVTLTLAT